MDSSRRDVLRDFALWSFDEAELDSLSTWQWAVVDSRVFPKFGEKSRRRCLRKRKDFDYWQVVPRTASEYVTVPPKKLAIAKHGHHSCCLDLDGTLVIWHCPLVEGDEYLHREDLVCDEVDLNVVNFVGGPSRRQIGVSP